MRRLLCILLVFSGVMACNSASKDRVGLEESVAADAWRFESPEGVIKDSDAVMQSLTLSLQSNYPVWRENMTVSVDIEIKNTTKSFIHARVMPHLFIYDSETKAPLYWSNIDLSYAESVGPGTMSILSLPVGGVHSTPVPVRAIKFAAVDSPTLPEYTIYNIVPTGSYTMRLVLDFYSEEVEKIGTMSSNEIEFTTIFNAPEAIPSGEGN